MISSASVNPGQFAIGDTVHNGAPVRFPDFPRFGAGAFRARPSSGHAIQAVRRGPEAARGRSADAGVPRGEKPAASRSSESSAPCSRRDHEPAASEYGVASVEPAPYAAALADRSCALRTPERQRARSLWTTSDGAFSLRAASVTLATSSCASRDPKLQAEAALGTTQQSRRECPARPGKSSCRLINVRTTDLPPDVGANMDNSKGV